MLFVLDNVYIFCVCMYIYMCVLYISGYAFIVNVYMIRKHLLIRPAIGLRIKVVLCLEFKSH